MHRLALGVALLGALAFATPARAAERVASFPAFGHHAIAGVTPIAGEVAYGRRLASGAWWLGTTARTVAVLPAPAAGQVANARLEASADRFAWTRTVDTVRRLRIPDPLLEDRLFSRQPPGGPAQVDDCPPMPDCRISQSSYRFAVDGTMLAWLRTGYRLIPLTIDPGDGRPPRHVEIDADFVSHVTAAGGRVAYASTDYELGRDPENRIVVVDGDGRELLRIVEPPASWALQPDGKVVAWREAGPAWYSPQEPFPHSIPAAPRDEIPSVIGAAADQVAIRDGDWRTAQLRVVGLDGRERTLAELPAATLEAAGFDGTTLAWAALHCGVMGIWTARADASGPPWKAAAGPCPEFAARRPQLGRERIVVRLECPRGCRGKVTLVLRDRPWRELAVRRIAFGPSSRARVVRLQIGRAAARALRRTPTVLLQRFSGRDRTGEPVAAERVRSARPVGR